VEQNIFHMDESERAKLGIKSLPSSLAEAINLFEASSLMRDVLGKHIFTSLIANKRAEQDKFRTRITDVELAEYLPIL